MPRKRLPASLGSGPDVSYVKAREFLDAFIDGYYAGNSLPGPGLPDAPPVVTPETRQWALDLAERSMGEVPLVDLFRRAEMFAEWAVTGRIPTGRR